MTLESNENTHTTEKLKGLVYIYTGLCRWAGPKVKKLFFMLNSAEHEIFSANKFENANNSWHFHIY